MISLKALLLLEFVEVPFVGTDGPIDHDEVFVHFDDKWEPIRAYAYADSPLVKFDPDQWSLSEHDREQLAQYAPRTRKGKNALFVHFKGNPRTFLWWIEALGYVETDENV